MDQLSQWSSSSLSKPALALQRISALLTTTLLKCSAYQSWAHDLDGLIDRLSRRTRARHSIVHFAEQMDKAVNKFVSVDGDGDGMSALTPVDVRGLRRFIENFDLAPWPAFTAVSWFWGDAEHRDKMELDGQSLDMPFNAIRALRNLQDLRAASTPRSCGSMQSVSTRMTKPKEQVKFC